MLNLIEGMEATKDQIIANGKRSMDRMKEDFALSKIHNYDPAIYDFYEKLRKNNAEHFRNTQLEELQQRFLSVQTKMAMGYQPKDPERARAFQQEKESYLAAQADQKEAKNKKPEKQAGVKQ